MGPALGLPVPAWAVQHRVRGSCGRLRFSSFSLLTCGEAATLQRRQRIEAFAGPSGELARIDSLRKSSVEELLKTLVEAER